VSTSLPVLRPDSIRRWPAPTSMAVSTLPSPKRGMTTARIAGAPFTSRSPSRPAEPRSTSQMLAASRGPVLNGFHLPVSLPSPAGRAQPLTGTSWSPHRLPAAETIAYRAVPPPSPGSIRDQVVEQHQALIEHAGPGQLQVQISGTIGVAAPAGKQRPALAAERVGGRGWPPPQRHRCGPSPDPEPVPCSSRPVRRPREQRSGAGDRAGGEARPALTQTTLHPSYAHTQDRPGRATCSGKVRQRRSHTWQADRAASDPWEM
jgi:hypothetical protein